MYVYTATSVAAVPLRIKWGQHCILDPARSLTNMSTYVHTYMYVYILGRSLW